MTAYILDTETHDIKDPRATEVAYVAVAFEGALLNPQTANTPLFQAYYNPLMPISLGSQATTLIFDEDVADKPPYTDFKLPNDCEYLIGHNIDFDCTVLQNAGCDLSHVKRICTLALAKHFYPNLDSHNLGALLCHFHKPIAKAQLKEAHSASYDIMFTQLVLQSICAEQGITSLEDLYRVSNQARIPTIISFGKHKGMAIKDLPQSYVNWLLNQDNLDPYLKQALEAV